MSNISKLIYCCFLVLTGICLKAKAPDRRWRSLSVEAYTEGNQRHLSAESAFYCRLCTEGLFGLRPTGFRSFTYTPRLPQA